MSHDPHIAETKLDEWHFDFGLYGEEGQLISQLDCEQLLDVIIDWAEDHGYCVGGGFCPFAEESEQ